MSEDMSPEKLKEFLASQRESTNLDREADQLSSEAQQRGPKDELQGRNR
ncbi:MULTISPECIES: hypothetical protein [Streptomyces]|uniref:Uncharacterized protein n=1 Tax=Streptomyces spirodelae TaxID=2812904 RepID=A0ABS3X2U6_9ACTN|nr:hypothetical protein [Streptomyces spirodelae]MBO8189702.1 hypothetical protein [Streptomyces spirodelae]